MALKTKIISGILLLTLLAGCAMMSEIVIDSPSHFTFQKDKPRGVAAFTSVCNATDSRVTLEFARNFSYHDRQGAGFKPYRVTIGCSDVPRSRVQAEPHYLKLLPGRYAFYAFHCHRHDADVHYNLRPRKFPLIRFNVYAHKINYIGRFHLLKVGGRGAEVGMFNRAHRDMPMIRKAFAMFSQRSFLNHMARTSRGMHHIR